MTENIEPDRIDTAPLETGASPTVPVGKDPFSPDPIIAALALYFVHYNWMRQHKSLNKWTPAMAAGLTDRVWSWEDILKLVDNGG